ncbi:MerR family transcriptional regulator [Aureimonas leprariae]|nr:MerR family transcriptional regulator [Aureimonas leprariae]
MRNSSDDDTGTAGQDEELSVERLLGMTDAANELKAVYRIGDLANEFGISLRSLRFYEARGLLQPARRGTTRLYSQDDRRRLRLILLCKLLSFSLTEIRQIVNAYLGTGSELQRTQGLRAVFEHQRSVLQAQRDDLDASMAALDASLLALDKPS